LFKYQRVNKTDKISPAAIPNPINKLVIIVVIIILVGLLAASGGAIHERAYAPALTFLPASAFAP